MPRPDFKFEKQLWKANRLVAGADEVGRGSFAGPVVAAAVVFNPNQPINQFTNQPTIDDSKKLSSRQRQLTDVWIRKNAIAWGLGKASVFKINKHGIKKATEIAFRIAIKNLNIKIDYLIVDAFYIPYVKGIRRKNQNPIIKGDQKSISIASASIIAKVYRDNLMTKLGSRKEFQMYLWQKNKGYGTQSHRTAIGKFGVTTHHRILFVKNCLKNGGEVI